MYANSFLDQQRRSPVSFAAVLGLHVAALGAVIMFGTTTFAPQKAGNMTIFDVPIEEPPPPDQPPPPRQQEETPRQVDRVTVTPPVVPTTPSTLTTQVTPPTVYHPPVTPPGPVRYAELTTPRIPDPVRIAAQVDPRYRDALQPPYPREMETAQREGSVRVRITIGTDGRVTAIEQVGGGANESFWRVTERQARTRWRFRPATVDGRPIVSTMVFTVTFRLPEA